VAGQAVIPVLVSAKEKILDREAFATARSFSVEEADDTFDQPRTAVTREPVAAG